MEKTEKDTLWKDLKLQWSYLKRGSNASESDKGKAKERINEIQDKLGLEKTNWNANRQQPGTHLQNGNGGGASGGSSSNNVLTEKILGTVLEMRREMNEQLLDITQKLNKMEASVSS